MINEYALAARSMGSKDSGSSLRRSQFVIVTGVDGEDGTWREQRARLRIPISMLRILCETSLGSCRSRGVCSSFVIRWTISDFVPLEAV